MKGTTKAMVLILFSLAVLIPFASTHPDGLERVAESLGIEGTEPLWRGLMPDYTIQSIENPYTAALISGLIGLLLVFSVAWGIGWATSTRK